MDIDNTTTSASILDKKEEEASFMVINNNTDYIENIPFENSYYYTSEIIISPNGLVALTFEKAFNDIKFRVTEGNLIVDLFLSWMDQETAKNIINSKFEINYYSEGMYI